MPRAAKPLALHELQGTKSEAQLPTDSRVPAGRPKFPVDISPETRPIFKRLCKLLEQRRTLTAGDSELLRLYVIIFDRHRRAMQHVQTEGEICVYTRLDSNGTAHQVEKENLWLKVAVNSEKNMVAILDRLGLSPIAKDKPKPARQSRVDIAAGTPGTVAYFLEHSWGAEDVNDGAAAVPPWTLSNEKVRAVIFERLKQYVRHVRISGAGSGVRPDATMWELAKQAEKQRDEQTAQLASSLNDYQRNLLEAHKRATQNGIAGTWARLIYERYRLGMASNQISENMQGAMSPWAIRGNLQRLNDIARRLFPEDCLPRGKSYGKKKNYRDGHHPNKNNFDVQRRPGHFKVDYARALEMHKAGLSRESIAAEFSIHPYTVYRVLKKQGVSLRRGRPPRRVTLTDFPEANSTSEFVKEQEMKATLKKHLAILRALAARRPSGKLPTAKWLNENGYFRSYEVEWD